MVCITLHGGKFNVRTCDIRKWATMATWYESNFHPCHLYGIDDLFTNVLVQGTQCVIPDSLVPRNSFFDNLLRYAVELIYKVA